MADLKIKFPALIADVIFINMSFWSSVFLFQSSGNILNDNMFALCVIVNLASLIVFIKIGLYNAVLNYIDTKVLIVVSSGILSSVAVLVMTAFYLDVAIVKSVPYFYGVQLALLVGGSRIAFKALLNSKNLSQKEKVVIYGAGSAGEQLAIALNNGKEFFVAAFIDEDESKVGKKLLGKRIYAHKQLVNVIENLSPVKLLLAIPSVDIQRRKAILLELEHLPVKVQSIPGINDLIQGKHKIDDIHDVNVNDLLGRKPVSPEQSLLKANIVDKIVMVTGAGGSIGSELCRQIIKIGPKKLILFELSEYALYSIDKELLELKEQLSLNVEVFPLLGSVQRENRLNAVIESFSVQTLYHAAAYKHVPLVEFNVVEGVRNNVFGTLAVAKAAIAAKVETFVLISTDKAVRPTNVMGATKRMAELVLQALSNEHHKTRFCMVRFGNVLGSSGSVVPLFTKQIEQGGPITITHPEITRYFMTIPEASQLVIQAGAMGLGGDVFVLDMGEPVKIHDLATKMVHLSGHKVANEKGEQGTIEFEFTGLRPGEKLYEELLIGDNVSGTKHERIMTAHEQYLPWSQLKILLDELDEACHNFEHQRIRDLLLSAPTAFSPNSGIEDLVWNNRPKHLKVLK
ncbi:polysaccharide biosynthesis protein [Pseudoalteromonas sp. SSM20]|uniref:polysaccharide biosynthesis protein n=1 Tax=Pseudoalteromonas sp. SSM20 TaxID=3139394 RepID=UPI003BAD980F